MNIPEEEIHESLLTHLFKTACECLRGELVAFEDDSEKAEKLCAAGFITQEIITSKLRPKTRFSFAHKTLLEFMAASYVTRMEEKKRRLWLESLDAQEDESLIRFIIGTSKRNSDVIRSTAETLLHIASLHYDLFHYTHLYARLICEMGEVVPLCGATIAATHPRTIFFLSGCSDECFRASEILVSLPLLHSIDIDFDGFAGPTDSMKDLMRQLKNTKCINEVTLYKWRDIKSLNDCLRLMGAGEEDSCVRRIAFDFDWERKINAGESLAIGNAVDSWKFVRCKNYEHTREFFKSAAQQPLTALHADFLTTAQENLLLNTNLQHLTIQHYDKSESLSPLLIPLSELRGLKSLPVEIYGISREEIKHIVKVLRNNELTSLEITTECFMEALSDVLTLSQQSSWWSCFPRMVRPPLHSLQHLSITYLNLSDHQMTIRTLTAIQRLDLKLFECEYFIDEHLSFLNKAISCWKNLHTLSLGCMKGEKPPSSLREEFRGLFCTIAKRKELEILTLKRMKLDDSFLGGIVDMLSQLPELKTFSLSENLLSEDAVKQIGECLRQRSTKLDKLDILRQSDEFIGSLDVKRWLKQSSFYVL
jgi:hypothetical protein